VPVLVTGCPPERLLQNGVPAYEIVAAGNVVIVIVLDAVTKAHPPDAAMVLVIV
jgi:hypothetical protein